MYRQLHLNVHGFSVLSRDTSLTSGQEELGIKTPTLGLLDVLPSDPQLLYFHLFFLDRILLENEHEHTEYLHNTV